MKEKILNNTNKIQANLKELLTSIASVKDSDSEFIAELLQKCILVGNITIEDPLYFNDIENLIRSKYTKYLSSEPGKILLKMSRELVDNLCYISQVSQALEYPIEDIKDLRSVLDMEILNFCNELAGNKTYQNNEDIFLIGDQNEI